MRIYTAETLCNIQSFAAECFARAQEHREKFERTGDRIYKIYWKHSMQNAATFAAIVRREMGNV